MPWGSAIVTGGLLGLSAPGVVGHPAAGWLAWLAFLPLLWALTTVSVWRAAWLGGVAALVLQGIACSWFPGLLSRFNGLHPIWGVAITLLILVAQSLGWAAWASSVRWLSERWPLVIAAPIPFLAVESIMPMLFPFSVGLTQYGNPTVAQAAELGGPQVISSMIVAVGAMGAQLARRGKAALPSAVAAAVGVAALLALGAIRVASVHEARSHAPSMRVGWIQASFAHTDWSPPLPDTDALVRYQHASADLETRDGPVDLLVWPEKAYGLLPLDAKHDFAEDHGRRVRRGFESTLLFGHTSVDRQTRELGNAAALLERGGRLRVVYQKNRLIPYSEWLPAWAEQRFGRRYRAGTANLPAAVDDVPVGVFICFESTFPSYVRGITGQGAQLLVNLSDDTWFGDSAEPEQHLAHAVFRAIENRRDLVRATGGGISAIVSATGEVMARTELNRAKRVQAAAGEVRLLHGTSVYGTIGEAVPAGAVVLWCLGILTVLWRRLHHGPPSNGGGAAPPSSASSPPSSPASNGAGMPPPISASGSTQAS